MPLRSATTVSADVARVGERTQEGYVPGLGKVSVEKLAQKGVTTQVQLMGEFLLKGRSRTEFCKLLIEAGGLRQKCAARGVRVVSLAWRRVRAWVVLTKLYVLCVCGSCAAQRLDHAEDGHGDAG
jgi:hypothetical protein